MFFKEVDICLDSYVLHPALMSFANFAHPVFNPAIAIMGGIYPNPRSNSLFSIINVFSYEVRQSSEMGKGRQTPCKMGTPVAIRCLLIAIHLNNPYKSYMLQIWVLILSTIIISSLILTYELTTLFHQDSR